jgi:hypothetical protein
VCRVLASEVSAHRGGYGADDAQQTLVRRGDEYESGYVMGFNCCRTKVENVARVLLNRSRVCKSAGSTGRLS